jgi:hypothetical protein
VNGFSDLLCKLFVSMSMEDVGKFPNRCRPEQLVRGFTGAGVEPQVQRSSRFESKPARSIRKLIGRQTEIDENAIDGIDAKFVQFFAEMHIAGMNKFSGIEWLQPLPCEIKHHRVAVKTQQGSTRFDSRTNHSTMATSADGPVDNSEFRLEIKILNNFAQQDRLMNRTGLIRSAAISHWIGETPKETR